MKESLIYVCSPLGASTKAEILTNAAKACVYMAQAEKLYGSRAVAPHAYLPHMLDDNVPEERALATEFGRKLLALCSRVAVFGDRISNGMKAEIEMAERLGIPVDYQHMAPRDGKAPAPALSADADAVPLQHEVDNWYKFYMTFNDDNREHAECAYLSNRGLLFDETPESLRAANQRWYAELREHGFSDEEIVKHLPEAAEYRPA